MTSPSVATSVVEGDAGDLLALTTALVAVPSESHHETELADLVESRLRARAPSLTIDRIDTNVIARTTLGRDRRVVLGVAQERAADRGLRMTDRHAASASRRKVTVAQS